MAEMRESLGAVIAVTMLLLPASALSQSTAATLGPQPPVLSRHVSSPVDKWIPFITKASKRFGVPSVWIRAVMRVESDGQTTQNGIPITSPAGAMGLMQVMPDTYADVQTRYGLGHDPYDPQDNIMAGAAYLHEMYLRYGYPDLFAGYNAGPARFDRYLYDGTSLPAETMAYLEALGQLQFAMPQPGDLAAGNDENFTDRSVGVAGKAASNLAVEAPGMAGLMPSSRGLFVALQTQSSDQP
jgi:soluble lytic murein transglycosylase-like protein